MASGSGRRGRLLIYVAIILILGLVLLWALVLRPKGGGTGLGVQNAPTPVAQEEMVNIVVTTQKVQRGIPLTEAVLTTIPYPKKSMDPTTFFTSVKEVVGKRPKVDLDPKVPVTSSLVVDSTGGSVAAFQIPKGMVAISIPINRLSSVSYAPQAGDHVNILASMLFVDVDQNFQTVLPNNTAVVTAPGASPTGTTVSAGIVSGGATSTTGREESALGQSIYMVPSEPQRPRMVTQTLLQDAIVLQVGTFPTETEVAAVVQPTPTANPNEQQPPATTAPTTAPRPDVITLVVSPQDAVTLNYLVFQRQLNLADTTKFPTSGAQLTLVLRGSGDDSRVQTEAVTLQYLMDQYNIPIPAKLPYTLQPNVGVLTSPWLEQDANILAVQPH